MKFNKVLLAIFILFFSVYTNNQEIPADSELLDEIKSEIITSNPEGNDETNIITLTDIGRRGFDGHTYTLEELENEDLANSLGKILNINFTNDDINRNLKKMNLNEKQIKELSEKWLYPNIEAFYDQFKKIYRANSAISYEIGSKIIASEEEIKQVYEENPIYQEAQYILEITTVYSNDNKETFKKELELYSKGKIKKPDYVNWELQTTVKESEISKENKFILKLKTTEIYVKETPEGFDLFKLINKRQKKLIPLEERKNEIVANILKEKHELTYKKLIQDLRSQAIIFRFDNKI